MTIEARETKFFGLIKIGEPVAVSVGTIDVEKFRTLTNPTTRQITILSDDEIEFYYHYNWGTDIQTKSKEQINKRPKILIGRTLYSWRPTQKQVPT